MKWNNDKGYISYRTSLSSIQSLLGISTTYFDIREETLPYVTYSLEYINRRFILLGEELDVLTYIEEMFNIFDHGADLILNGKTRDLLWEIGIDDSDLYIENVEIPYNQDRFVFAWANVTTALIVQLKLMYADLLQPAADNCGCPCEYPSGQTTKDYDEWTSGVYPNDEDYTPVVSGTVGGSAWRSVDQWPSCTKCNR